MRSLFVPAALVVALPLSFLGLGACSSGGVDLVLDVPDDPTLAPASAATITLLARKSDQPTRATSSALAEDGTFELGRIAVGDGFDLAVEMRSATQRVVGYGRAGAPVEVTANDVIEVVIPVRRPFVYMTGGGDRLIAFDSTRDAADPGYQSEIALPEAASLAIPAGGQEVAIIADQQDHAVVRRLITATHEIADAPPLEIGGGVRDAAASPDGHWLVIGHTSGMTVVDLTSGEATPIAGTGDVERVAIGSDPSGKPWAIGLVGRAEPPACEPSRLAVVALGGAASADMIDVGRPLIDIGADDVQPVVVGVDACGGALVKIPLDEPGFPDVAPMVEMLAEVPAPTAVAALGGRAWAIGSVAGVIDNEITTEAAHLVLVSAGLAGGGSARKDLPPVVESMVAIDAEGQDVARNLKAGTAVAYDLAVVPPGNQVALAYHATFHAPTLVATTPFGQVPIIPRMDATSDEYLLLDADGAAPVHRVRTSCELEHESGAFISTWECRRSPGQDAAVGAGFHPAMLSVLYGGR